MQTNQKPISILVVDDNHEICQAVKDHFSATKDMRVIDVAHDGHQGYQLFLKLAPDVVLLDLIMPYMDGFSFLEQVDEDNLKDRSKIIAISGIRDDKFINHALSLGASYYIMKPFDLPVLEKRIRRIMKSSVHIKETYAKLTSDKPQKLSQADIQRIIAKSLIDTGVPVHTLGYKYLQSAIQYLLEQKTDVFSITKTIYPYIAGKYETSSSCVDKAMRHSINLAYQDNRHMLSYFLSQMNYHDSKARPSNSEFINLTLEKIKQEISDLRS